MASSVVDVFPFLVPLSSTFDSYQGFITVQGYEYQFLIHLNAKKHDTTNNSLQSSSIECSEELRKLLKGQESILQQRLMQSKDLPSFLLELKDVLERVIRTKKLEEPPPPSYYAKLIEEMNTIGWGRLHSIDNSLKSVEVTAKDKANRSHLLTMNFPADYPATMPTCSADLPAQPKWQPTSASITEALKQFEKMLEEFQEFWNMLDDIDNNTWVLEPERKNYSAQLRRIALGNHCSICVTVDWKRPRSIPESQFLGSDSLISPLRDSFNNNLGKWNLSKTLRENLETVLGVTFPSPKTSNKEDFSEECGICYSFRLENMIPDRVCDNQKCSKGFHRSCLSSWLRAIPGAKQSFDTVFGECPYCNSPISVKM